jgi:hypothetical protein
MIIPHNFKMNIYEYAAKGKENDFPVFDHCPSCGCLASGNLHRHGYYWRYGIEGEDHIRIPICRYKCLSCGITISILPDFLIPYFQYTLHMIIEGIRRLLNKEKRQNRQLQVQHANRFYEKFHWVHSFFVDEGYRAGLSGDMKKEALKYITRIVDMGVSTFFRRSWGHLSTYFMGKLFLPYLSRENNKISPT